MRPPIHYTSKRDFIGFFNNIKVLYITVTVCTRTLALYHVPKRCGRIQCSLRRREDRSRHGCSSTSFRGTPRPHRNHIWPPNCHKHHCISYKTTCSQSEVVLWSLKAILIGMNVLSFTCQMPMFSVSSTDLIMMQAQHNGKRLYSVITGNRTQTECLLLIQ